MAIPVLRGPYTLEQVERYLWETVNPVRLACFGNTGSPVVLSLWLRRKVHERRLRANPRPGPAVLGRRRLGAAERRAVRALARTLLARLDRA